MPGKSSILFMHDDGRCRRWRMKQASARILLALLCLLPCLTLASLGLNFFLLKERSQVQSDLALLQAEAAKQAQTAIRLSNLEQYLRESAPEGLSNLGLISPSEQEQAEKELGAVVPGKVIAEAEALALGQALAAAEAEAAAEANNAEREALALAEQNQASQKSETSLASTLDEEAQNALADQAQEDKAGDLEAEELSDEEDESGIISGQSYPELLTEENLDLDLVRLDKLTLRQPGPHSLRISFELYNKGQKPRLNGWIGLTLLLPDGRAYKLARPSETSYRISNMKRVILNPEIPAELGQLDQAKVRIEVFEEQELIYRKQENLQP